MSFADKRQAAKQIVGPSDDKSGLMNLRKKALDIRNHCPQHDYCDWPEVSFIDITEIGIRTEPAGLFVVM